MDRVLDRLWIGSTTDLHSPLAHLGFEGILDLRDRPADETGVKTFRVSNRDGDPWNHKQVIEALDFITARIRHGKVLIICVAGMSRSASMVIGYLVRAGWDVTEAFELVRAARPRIAPVAKMLTSVLQAVRS